MNRKNVILTTSTYSIEKDKINKNNSDIAIPENCKTDLIKAMKIGYYKEFYKQGLIIAEQLEQLIAMQNNQLNSVA